MTAAEKIRTIVVDLDRTLLRTDKTVSARTLEVLKACREKGMGIMVATARPLRAIEEYRRAVDFDGMVVSNGARVICGAYQRDHGIDPQSAAKVLRRLSRHSSLLITLETGAVAYSNRPVPDYETVISEDLAEVAEAEGALKLLVGMDHPGTLETVRECLTEELYYTLANGHLIQIMNRDATKWNGIRTMLALSGRTPEETVYFGDDNDDIEPIRMCGWGVAMANGIEEAKKAADYVAESNDADGVAGFLEKMLLSKP